MRRTRRSWDVLKRLVPLVVAYWRDRRRWMLFGAPRAMPVEAHRIRAARIVDAIAALGPTYIKLAQVFSSRADILPEPYLSEISRLQDAVEPVPVEASEAVLAAELGRPV